MPFPSWLRALLPRRPAHPTGPVAGEQPLRDGAPTDSGASDDASNAIHAGGAAADTGVRMHIAAHDPDFPAKREAAVLRITAALDAVAAAHGFTKKPKSWAKSGPLGTVSLHLQRSRFGFDCMIELGFQPSDAAPQNSAQNADQSAPSGPWAHEDFIPLGRFYPPALASLDSTGTLIYLDVLNEADALHQPMAVLSDHALPWLLAHLTNADAATCRCHPNPPQGLPINAAPQQHQPVNPPNSAIHGQPRDI